MSESRTLSLGRRGEAEWPHLSAAYRLSPDKGVTAVFADRAEVRGEIRRRLESLGAVITRLEPGRDLLRQIQELAAGSLQPPVAWIEAVEVADPELAWREGLIALNRGRDLIWDRGPVFVVVAGPTSLNLTMRRQAPDFSSVVEPMLLLDDTLEPLVEASEPLCWLHLSDLHVQSDNWEQDIVLRALVRDLPGLLEQVGRKPQLIFVTGDVANRGVHSEYEGAFKLLDELCAKLGLHREQHLFMVPGNHDVDRSSISKSAELLTRAFDGMGEDEFRGAIGDLIGAPADFELFGRRLSGWCHFTSRLLGPARHVSIDQPWRSDVVELAGISVGIASICSAWMSGAKDAKDRLVVGQRQVQMLVDELASAGADLRIALIHHPVAWLREVEERAVEGLLHDEFDVVLHGHVHHPKAGTFVHGRRSTVEIGAGAAYAGLGQDRFHGFTVAQIDPAREQIEVDAFTWTSRTGHWHIDAGFHKDAPLGRLTLPLRLVRLGEVKRHAAKPDELAVRLRRAVVNVHGSQSFIGLPDDAPKPRASLHDMFVPLELRARSGAEGDRRELATLTRSWLRAYANGERAPRVVVLGDPGSGKTTLSRYLAVSAAEAEGGLCPLLLSVRDWEADGVRYGLLEQAQRYAAATLSVRTDVDALTDLCEQGRVILLVDGVDETGPRQREALRNSVQSFAGVYPRVPVVVTSRITGYDEAPLDHQQFDHLMLAPFDDGQLREFIRRWYAVAEPDNPAERRRREAELWAALQSEPRASQLARNPLLATLLALVHFHRAQLPGDRAMLYRLCVETLVVTWPAACGREFAELPGHRQLPLLEELALWMQSQRPEDIESDDLRGITITGEQLDRRLLELLEGPFQDFDEGRRRDLAHKWRRWLIRASGLIQEQQSDRYGFLHLSLMEYLAGQAVWRAQVRHGYDAIARFVVERQDASWQETLLLMLGSHNGDRALGDEVVRALLDVEPRSWTTCMFLLALLREEIDLDSVLRIELLDAVSENARDQGYEEWREAQLGFAQILRFGRKHGLGVTAWSEAAMARRSGEGLLGALVLLPEELGPTAAMQRRDDDDLGIVALLDLAGHPWGRWAAQRAQPSSWLAWARGTPIERIVMRGVVSAFKECGPSGVWVVGLLRRILWLGETMTAGARALRAEPGGGGAGVPASMRWTGKFGEVRCPTGPAIVSASGPIPRDIQRCFSARYVEESLWYFSSEYFPVRLVDFLHGLGTRFDVWFDHVFAREFVHSNAQSLARVFVEYAPARFWNDLHRVFRRNNRSLERELQVSRTTTRQVVNSCAPDSGEGVSPLGPSMVPDAVERTGGSIIMAMVADAHAGLLLTPSGQPAADIAAARVENRWIHTFFDHLVTRATNKAPLTPEQQALFLALGLAQYQTTWSWPPGPHWRAWFTAAAPEHWLPAYVWHLCWAIGEPANPEHRARAAACLDRGDWPELVAELRDLDVTVPSDEVRALFDGWLPD